MAVTKITLAHIVGVQSTINGNNDLGIFLLVNKTCQLLYRLQPSVLVDFLKKQHEKVIKPMTLYCQSLEIFPTPLGLVINRK